MNDKELLKKIFKMLTENPYVSEIYLFGSRATQSSDDLSDIDLTTTTLYPVDTEAHIRQRLSDEFDVTAIYTIIYDKHEIARSFCLTGVSPFCKIDIGFSLPDKTSFFPNSKRIFQNNHIHTPSKKRIQKWIETPAEHDYLDIMMGSLRYIKHRRRNENWQAYKCYRGFIEQFAKLHTIDGHDENIYKMLDKQNNNDIMELFFKGTVREKEQKYYQFVKNLATNKHLLRQFSSDILKCWEEHMSD